MPAPRSGGGWAAPHAEPRPALPEGPYLVAGLGRAGLAASRALARDRGADSVTAWDAVDSGSVGRARAELEPLGVRTHAGGDGVDLLRRTPRPACLVKSPGIPPEVPLLRDARELGIPVVDEAELGWRRDGRPLVGVTGTNGKSTVAALAVAVLGAAGAGPVLAGNTVFGPPLSALAEQAGDVVVAELSSFQLEACPALLPEVAVFTNMTDDHWERHRGRAAYEDAKRRMFVRAHRCAPVAVVNLDDPYGARLAREVAERGGFATGFGASGDAHCRLVGCDWTLTEGRADLVVAGEAVSLRTRLPGWHNAMNAAAALALATTLGVGSAAAAAAIEGTEPVPGRFEYVGSAAGVDVVVDYAHNPDGLRQALATARHPVEPRGGRVVVVAAVLAAVVERRQRIEMGRVLGALADCIVVTLERQSADEPRDQPPAGLVEGIRSAGGRPEVVPERRAAIHRALAIAREGDVVLIVNRGARAWDLDTEDRRREFDDRVEARAALEAVRA